MINRSLKWLFGFVALSALCLSAGPSALLSDTSKRTVSVITRSASHDGRYAHRGNELFDVRVDAAARLGSMIRTERGWRRGIPREVLGRQNKNGAGSMIGTVGQLTGVVTDSTTTRPVGGAQVSLLRNGRYRTAFSAVTQTNGRYWILQVPDDSYTVTTRHSGYALQAHQEVSVVADSTIRIDFQLVPNTQGH